MLPLVPKPSCARLLLEEGFLPPLGSQVFEGFDLAAGSMVSVCVNYKSGSPGPRKGPQSTQESSEEH